MEHEYMRFAKIVIFILLWAVSSRVFIALMAKRRPGVRAYEPEVIFPSVLAAALITKLIMLAVKAVIA